MGLKNKQLKKFWAVSMAAMFLLTGCSGGAESTPDVKEPEKQETSKEEKKDQAPAEEKKEETKEEAKEEPKEELSKTEQLKAELDFGGETIVFCYPPGYGLIDTTGASPSLARRDARLEELEEKYNVNIEQRDDATTYWENMVTSIASGAPEGHIMVTQDRQLLSWAEAGAVADLSTAMEKTGIDFKDETKYSQVVRTYTNFNDEQYGFSEPANYVGAPYWFYNKRIFDEMQLGDPNEMVANGEWTWDKVTEIAQKATKRSVDGTIEQYGLGGMLIYDMLGSLCQSNGTNMVSFDDTGKAVLTLQEPAAMKAFQQLSDWVFRDKMVLYNDGSLDWDATINDFITGKVAIMVGTNPILGRAAGTPMEDDFGILPAPMGPDVDKYTIAGATGQFYFIPKTYEDMADKLLLLIDDLYALQDGMTREDMVVEGYGAHVRDEESLENYINMALNYDPSLFELTVTAGLDWSSPSIMEICNKVARGEATPADVIEQNKVQMQTLLDDKFSKMIFTGK